MTELLSMSTIGTFALKEGIKFFYNQATDILKRWRDKKNDLSQNSGAEKTETVGVQMPEIFEKRLGSAAFNFEAAGTLEKQIYELRNGLRDYVDGLEDVSPQNKNLLRVVDGLRRCIEAIYSADFTFKGEKREETEKFIKSSVTVNDIAGYVAGVRMKCMPGGKIVAEVKAANVNAGGNVVGVDIDSL
jgi:hypothetical protein